MIPHLEVAKQFYNHLQLLCQKYLIMLLETEALFDVKFMLDETKYSRFTKQDLIV